MPVGAIDDDGVAQWNIETVLDDSGRNQDVGLMPHEGEHNTLQFALRHLTVAHQDARLRSHLADLVRDLIDALYPVMHEVDLPAALQFFIECRAQQFFIPGRNHGLDRHAIFGRSLDDAHVAQTQQRHVQGARDGRCRHGQYVYFFAQLLEAFLVTHTEALLFVYDHQPQIAELDVFRQYAMRADDDINLTGLDFRDGFLLLLGRAKTAEHLDLDRECRKALSESVEVLEGKH